MRARCFSAAAAAFSPLPVGHSRDPANISTMVSPAAQLSLVAGETVAVSTWRVHAFLAPRMGPDFASLYHSYLVLLGAALASSALHLSPAIIPLQEALVMAYSVKRWKLLREFCLFTARTVEERSTNVPEH